VYRTRRVQLNIYEQRVHKELCQKCIINILICIGPYTQYLAVHALTPGGTTCTGHVVCNPVFMNRGFIRNCDKKANFKILNLHKAESVCYTLSVGLPYRLQAYRTRSTINLHRAGNVCQLNNR
jgi:hypothetical protein